jgi:hypothetical protein
MTGKVIDFNNGTIDSNTISPNHVKVEPAPIADEIPQKVETQVR